MARLGAGAARRYRVFRPDQRGFGNSTPMREDFPWTIDVPVADLERFVSEIDVGSVHVVAAKFGGTVAIAFAARYPELVKMLSLVGVPPSTKKSLGARIPSWLDCIRREGAPGWAKWTMGRRLGSAMPAAGVEWWTGFMGKTDSSTLLGFVSMLPDVDVTAELAKIRCPTLVVTSDDSELGAVQEVEAWQRQIPDSKLVVLRRDSYHIAASDADACARLTRDFIDQSA